MLLHSILLLIMSRCHSYVSSLFDSSCASSSSLMTRTNSLIWSADRNLMIYLSFAFLLNNILDLLFLFRRPSTLLHGTNLVSSLKDHWSFNAIRKRWFIREVDQRHEDVGNACGRIAAIVDDLASYSPAIESSSRMGTSLWSVGDWRHHHAHLHVDIRAIVLLQRTRRSCF